MGRYDENDQEHYDRPRRRTRPRTKDRPTYDEAVDGVVVAVDRGRFTLLIDGAKVMAMKSRPLGRKGVVVGDHVRVVGDVSGLDGSLARIVEVTERVTTTSVGTLRPPTVTRSARTTRLVALTLRSPVR